MTNLKESIIGHSVSYGFRNIYSSMEVRLLMKRTRWFIPVIFILLSVSPLAAQDKTDNNPFAQKFAFESIYEPIRLNLIKIYQTAYGFILVCNNYSDGITNFYVPFEWFRPGGNATIVMDDHPSFPYLVVYLKNEVFDHLRLYVPKTLPHPLWEYITSTSGLKEKFNIDKLEFDF